MSIFGFNNHKIICKWALTDPSHDLDVEKKSFNCDPDVIRTRNLLIWSQTRYRCATESFYATCELHGNLISCIVVSFRKWNFYCLFWKIQSPLRLQCDKNISHDVMKVEVNFCKNSQGRRSNYPRHISSFLAWNKCYFKWAFTSCTKEKPFL